MSIQAGAHCLEKAQGGRGLLLGGVAGVAAARVVVLGGGVVGTNAARMAMGLEAHVTVIDRSLGPAAGAGPPVRADAEHHLLHGGQIEEHVLNADLVIGAVLLPGRRGAEAGDARR